MLVVKLGDRYMCSLFNFLNFAVYFRTFITKCWKKEWEIASGENPVGSLASSEFITVTQGAEQIGDGFELVLISSRVWYVGESGLQGAHNWEEDFLILPQNIFLQQHK